MTAKTALLSGKQALHALLSPADRFTCLLFWLSVFFFYLVFKFTVLPSLTNPSQRFVHIRLFQLPLVDCTPQRFHHWVGRSQSVGLYCCIDCSCRCTFTFKKRQEKKSKTNWSFVVCFVLCFHHLRNFFFALKVAFRSWSADFAVVKRWYWTCWQRPYYVCAPAWFFFCSGWLLKLIPGTYWKKERFRVELFEMTFPWKFANCKAWPGLSILLHTYICFVICSFLGFRVSAWTTHRDSTFSKGLWY